MNALLISHYGLGDSLTMIGAVRYLSSFYEKFYFACKDKHYENVKLFFIDCKNVICIPINQHNEHSDTINIISNAYHNISNDIFLSGVISKMFAKRVNNKKFIEENKYDYNDTRYRIEYDLIKHENYSFVNDFYRQIGLNLDVYYNYFSLPSTPESIELYESIKNYNIIFIQLNSSEGKNLNIKNLVGKYLFDENAILICNDLNIYDKSKNVPEQFNQIISTKKGLAEKFVYNKMCYYYDTLINSKEIYSIDSCFCCMILPLLKQNKLKADIVRIIPRNIAHAIEL